MQNNPDHVIGFERLLLIFKDAQNQAPKSFVSFVRREVIGKLNHSRMDASWM
jgi:hypothetical protein